MSFFVFLVQAEIPIKLYEFTYITSEFPIWTIIGVVWSFFLVAKSTKGLYLSTFRKIILTMIISIFQERWLHLFAKGTKKQPLIWSNRINQFTLSISIAIIASCFLWIIVRQLPSKLFGLFIKYFSPVFCIFGAMMHSRVFSLSLHTFNGLDPRLLLVASIGISILPEIIELASRRTFHNRAETNLTRMRHLVIVGLIYASIFQFITRPSLSSIFGRYQYPIIMQILQIILVVKFILVSK